jgi:hypothetical protein
MNIQEYLATRVKEIETSIASEVLSGNKVKEQCERFALTEITAIGIEIARQNQGSAEQRQSTTQGPKSAPEIVESDSPCDYCDLIDGCSGPGDHGSSDRFDCFKGRRLSPVA